MNSIQPLYNDLPYALIAGFGAGVVLSVSDKKFPDAMKTFAVAGSFTTASILAGRGAHLLLTMNENESMLTPVAATIMGLTTGALVALVANVFANKV